MSSYIEMTGVVCGKLTALSYAGKGRWLCACACGKQKNVDGRFLREERVKSCGACEKSKPNPDVDIRGQKFGHWTAIECASPGSWRCACDCGASALKRIDSLVGGTSTGCRECQTKPMAKPKPNLPPRHYQVDWDLHT